MTRWLCGCLVCFVGLIVIVTGSGGLVLLSLHQAGERNRRTIMNAVEALLEERASSGGIPVSLGPGEDRAAVVDALKSGVAHFRLGDSLFGTSWYVVTMSNGMEFVFTVDRWGSGNDSIEIASSERHSERARMESEAERIRWEREAEGAKSPGAEGRGP